MRACAGWLIDGAEVPLSAVRRSGRPFTPAAFRQTGSRLRCRFLRGGQSGTAHGFRSLAEQGADRTPRHYFRASLRLGFDTFLAQYPDYNDQLFPHCSAVKNAPVGLFFFALGRAAALFTDAPTASLHAGL